MMTNLPKRLAIFLPELLGGGAQRVMLNLAKGFIGKGYAVDLVLAQAKGPYLAEIPQSVHLVNLNSKGVLASLPAFMCYLRNERPTGLLSSLHANIVALWAKRLIGFPLRLVVVQHNTLSLSSRQAADLRLRLMPQLIKYFYPWADDIVAVSNGVASDLSRMSGIPLGRIKVIYNPIVTFDMQNKTKAPIIHPWFKAGEPPVILGIGRLSKIKNFSLLIQAFASVRKIKSAHLLILGEGEERHALEELIKKLGLEQAVSLPGFVLNPYPFIAHSAAFVLSSISEGLPTALIEAMYCGISVIATDCPSGPREILADGQYGQLVPVGDVDSLSHAILKALDGDTPMPPRESWLPYDEKTVVDQYLDIML